MEAANLSTSIKFENANKSKKLCYLCKNMDGHETGGPGAILGPVPFLSRPETSTAQCSLAVVSVLR